MILYGQLLMQSAASERLVSLVQSFGLAGWVRWQ
jgi:hypothetical protein